MFEGLNGILSRLLHGTKNIGQELLTNLTLAMGTVVLGSEVQVVHDDPAVGTEKGKTLSEDVLNDEDKALLRASDRSNYTLFASARKGWRDFHFENV